MTSSLQRRLQLGLGASILVLLPLLIWGGGAAVRGLVREHALAGLSHDAEALLGAVRLAAAGRPEVPDAALAPVYRQPFSGHYFLVIDDTGVTQQSRSLWDHRVALDPVTAGERRVLELTGPQQQSLVVLAAGYRKDGRALTVAVAEDLGPIEDAIARYQLATALLAFAVLVGLLIVQRAIVHRAFRSLDGLREDVRRIENGEASGLREDVPDEVRPLVREVNRLLALLAQRLERDEQGVLCLTGDHFHFGCHSGKQLDARRVFQNCPCHHHRRATGGRLQRHQTKAFVQRGIGENVGAGVQSGQVALRDVPRKKHLRLHALFSDGGIDQISPPAVASGQYQPVGNPVGTLDPGKSLYQPGKVLAVLQRPDKQDVALQAVLLAYDFGAALGGKVAGIDAMMYHAHGHSEPITEGQSQIVGRALGDGDEPCRCAKQAHRGLGQVGTLDLSFLL